eukprot:g157.t1
MAATSSTTAVIAHRGFHDGSKGFFAENSLGAFQRAIDIGSTYVELDVHLSLDGVPVVAHDHKIDRTSIEGIHGYVSEKSAKDLANIRICREKQGIEEDAPLLSSAASSATKSAASKVHGFVPTLSEVLALASGSFSTVLIELKPKKVGNYIKCGCSCGRSETYAGLAKAVLRVCSQHPRTKVVMQSFCKEYIEEFARLNSDIECHLLVVGCYPVPFCPSVVFQWDVEGFHLSFDDPLRQAKQNSVSSINVARFFVTRTFIRRAHACGIRVFVWTVDDEDEMKRLSKWGVDGIITNCPLKCINVLKNAKRGGRGRSVSTTKKGL